MSEAIVPILVLVGFMAAAWLVGGGELFRDHWHFVGHRVPGACCGDRCPHHRPSCDHGDPAVVPICQLCGESGAESQAGIGETVGVAVHLDCWLRRVAEDAS